jgi:hypothetical protein
MISLEEEQEKANRNKTLRNTPLILLNFIADFVFDE